MTRRCTFIGIVVFFSTNFGIYLERLCGNSIKNSSSFAGMLAHFDKNASKRR